MIANEWISIKRHGLPLEAGIYKALTKKEPCVTISIEVKKYNNTMYWVPIDKGCKSYTHITHWSNVDSISILGSRLHEQDMQAPCILSKDDFNFIEIKKNE